jgi:hypothetical protein
MQEYRGVDKEALIFSFFSSIMERRKGILRISFCHGS